MNSNNLSKINEVLKANNNALKMSQRRKANTFFCISDTIEYQIISKIENKEINIETNNNDLTSEIINYKTEITKLKENISRYNFMCENYESNIKMLNTSINKLQKELSIKKAEISQLNKKIKSIDNNSLIINQNQSSNKIKNLVISNSIFFYLKPSLINNNISPNKNDQKKIILQKNIYKNIIKSIFFKYIFYKYYFRTSHLLQLKLQKELAKMIDKYAFQEKKMLQFQEIFKKYESSNNIDIKNKDTLISKYQQEICNLKQNNDIKNKNYNDEIKNKENLIFKYQQEISELNKNNEMVNKKLNEDIVNLTNENIKQKKMLSDLNKIIIEEKKLIEELNEAVDFYKNENTQNENKFNKKIISIKNEYNTFETKIDTMNQHLEKLQTDNNNYKTDNEKLIDKNNQLMTMIKNYKDYEAEYNNLMEEKLKLEKNYEELNSKYIDVKSENVKMRVVYENNKKEFSQALKEMDTYSQLLIALEEKMHKAENEKIQAEMERDKAVQETKDIRQRYINIMSSD